MTETRAEGTTGTTRAPWAEGPEGRPQPLEVAPAATRAAMTVSVLVTMDYPDAITNNLRRQTDLARGIIEKTRGDVTFSLRGEQLTRAIQQLSDQLDGGQIDIETSSGLPIQVRNEDD